MNKQTNVFSETLFNLYVLSARLRKTASLDDHFVIVNFSLISLSYFSLLLLIKQVCVK